MSYELDNFSAFLPLKHRQSLQKHTITFLLITRVSALVI